MKTEVIQCECGDCHQHPNGAPAIVRVRREGVELNVCSRCDLSTDERLGYCYTKEQLEADDELVTLLFNYDPLVVCLFYFITHPEEAPCSDES